MARAPRFGFRALSLLAGGTARKRRSRALFQGRARESDELFGPEKRPGGRAAPPRAILPAIYPASRRLRPRRSGAARDPHGPAEAEAVLRPRPDGGRGRGARSTS